MTENEYRELKKALKKRLKTARREYASDLKALDRVWWLANRRDPPAPEGTLPEVRGRPVAEYLARALGTAPSGFIEVPIDEASPRGAITDAVKEAVQEHKGLHFSYRDILAEVT